MGIVLICRMFCFKAIDTISGVELHFPTVFVRPLSLCSSHEEKYGLQFSSVLLDPTTETSIGFINLR